MTIHLEIDGQRLSATAGEMLICVTDRHGIDIPRFCYHEKLSVVANCRMCLVEVENAPKPLPACATPVCDGMRVFTQSAVARQAQQGTMEFLLINHPLDCPVCDQGGECPLQDQAMGYGGDQSRYVENKRAVASHDLGPLIATEMTRCIHCTRCVRFGEEIAGVLELGAPGRGEHMHISTFLQRPITSEVSGNMIDLCPVGALTSKPYRFAARAWELQEYASISPHDCLGSNINIQTLRGQVARVLPRENADINECWLADRDRFSYQAVNSTQRLTQPMLKRGGKWCPVDWQTALKRVAEGLQQTLAAGTPNDIGALATPTSTLEEFYLLQKLLRALGCENVDHRLQQTDFRDDDIAPRFPASELPIKAYNQLNAVLLVGSNLRKEQPLLSLRLRDGWQHAKTRIDCINPLAFDFNFAVESTQLAVGSELVARFATVARAVAQQSKQKLPAGIADYAATVTREGEASAARLLAAGDNGLIILGAIAQQHREASVLKAIAHWVAETTGNKIALLAPANSAAGWLAGCVPKAAANGSDYGDHVRAMLEHGKRAFVLLGCEPELDCLDGRAALTAMHKAEFVVQISSFTSKTANQYADVLLPMATFTETAGTFINCEGRVQASVVAAKPFEEARPAWKILRVLGNFLDCTGFDYVQLDEVTREISTANPFDAIQPSARYQSWRISKPSSTAARQSRGLDRIAEMPLYRGDATVRRAEALQHTVDNPPPAIAMNPAMITKYKLQAEQPVVVRGGAYSTRLTVRSDARLPDHSVYIPTGFVETTPLGGQWIVTLEKA